MAELIGYDARESVLMLAKSGSQPVLVSDAVAVRVKLGNKLDKQCSDNGNKGRVTFKGQELTAVTADWHILADEEQHFWGSVFPLLKEAGKNATANPLDITHRATNNAGVSTVSVESCEIGEADPVDGRSISVEFSEWAPRPVAPKKQTAAKAPIVPPTVPAADAASNTLGSAQ